MQIELTEAVWLDDGQDYTLLELTQCSGLSEADVRQLVDLGALAPRDPDAPQWTFSGLYVGATRTARRLRNDFELDINGVALVLSLLERVRNLESELRDLRARAPQRIR
jgi:chaperone modulatory protein CbpM